MANAVKAESGGRLDIQVFPNSQLGSQTAMLGQLRLGSIQLLNIGNSSYTGVVPVYSIDSVGFAWTTWKQPLEALAGPLGAYIRREFAAKGMYAFPKVFAFGYREITSSTHPIRSADDLVGFKIRTVPSAIIVEFFRALGSTPVPLDANELYTALQTHVVDGQDTALQVIASFRLFEVQKYLSVTNHTWTGSTMVANADALNALPSDIGSILKRNADKYADLASNDVYISNDSLADKLRRQGFTFNKTDTSTMRAKLGPYYTRWKNELGANAWNLLEAQVGKLA